jgi:predicted permease
MDVIIQDIRLALRQLRRKPGFAVVTLLTLALGIGANSTIFSVVNAILLRPLPYGEAQNLLFVSESSSAAKIKSFSLPSFYDWQEQNRCFDGLAAFRYENFNTTGDDRPERLQGAMVSANIIGVLGVKPMLGNTFSEQDDTAGARPVVILGWDLWQRRFGGDAQVVGKTLTLDGRIYSIIAVMPRSFTFPPFAKKAELWVPLGLFADRWNKDRLLRPALYGVARLKPGVTIDRARSEMDSVALDLGRKYPPTDAGNHAYLVSFQDHVVRDVRAAVLVLLGAVFLILLIACVNVANLLLVRGASRQRDIALRFALGASRGRIIQQLLTESLLISFLGAGLGLILAAVGLKFVVSISPANLPRVSEVSIDGAVLVFTLLLSILTGVAFGMAPALHLSKTDGMNALRDGSRSATVGSAQKRIRAIMVVSEIAFAFILLAVSGLVIRGFLKLVSTDPGLKAGNVLTMQMSLSDYKYGDDAKRRTFFHEVIRRVKTVPGVEDAAVIAPLPISGDGVQTPFVRADKPLPDPSQVPLSDLGMISPDYFSVMGVPLLRGRFFNEDDREDSLPVAIIDESLAATYFPGEEPLDKQIRMQGVKAHEQWMRIVGVVGHVKNYGVADESRVEMFIPYRQFMWNPMTLVAHTNSDPGTLAEQILGEIGSVDRDQPVYNIRKMADVLTLSLAPRRLSITLISLFAVLALVLGGVGVYGVMAYSVSERTNEFGIRIALGAPAGSIIKLVVGHGVLLFGIGIGIGLISSLLLGRFLTGLLFGLNATDPVSFLTSLSVLFVATMLATYLPARRAGRVDLVRALKNE